MPVACSAEVFAETRVWSRVSLPIQEIQRATLIIAAASQFPHRRDGRVVGQFALVLFGNLGLAGDLNHAEEVAIGIFQHDKVIIRLIPPGIASRPNLD